MNLKANMHMPGCIHFDLCLKTFDTIYTDIHRYYIYTPILYTPGESRWTSLPRPSAPPCRSTSPESKETRFEHHATAVLRFGPPLGIFSRAICSPKQHSFVPALATTLPPQLYRRASSTLAPQLSVSPHSSRRTSKTHPSRPRRQQRS